MPGPKYAGDLIEVAAAQGGYVTTSDAVELGIPLASLVMLERRGTLERVSRGIYRVRALPRTARSQYWEAALWPAQRGVPKGVISHQSALALYDLSDVNPSKVHVTVPRASRIRRTPPAYLKLHHQDLHERDITDIDGLPLTTVMRTINDCRASGLGGLVDDAVDQALQRGLITKSDLINAGRSP